MDRIKAVICALWGHSRIVTMCFGYVSCSRCEEQIGDTMMGAFDLRGYTVVGHNCDDCRTAYAKMNWKDRILTPKPFVEAK